jgi:hypothetical protein
MPLCPPDRPEGRRQACRSIAWPLCRRLHTPTVRRDHPPGEDGSEDRLVMASTIVPMGLTALTHSRGPHGMVPTLLRHLDSTVAAERLVLSGRETDRQRYSRAGRGPLQHRVGRPAHRVGHFRPMEFIPAQHARKGPSTTAEDFQRPVWWQGRGEFPPSVTALRSPGPRLAWRQGRPLPQPARANALLVAHAATAAGARAGGEIRRRGIMPRQTSR